MKKATKADKADFLKFLKEQQDKIPDEEWDKLPRDLSQNLEDYTTGKKCFKCQDNKEETE